MGWTDSHLHQFEKDGKYWGVPEYDEDDDIDLIDESKVPVSRVLKTEGDSVVYLYDFGDDWRHQVVLEEIVTSDIPTKHVCIAGERKCPPEDSGAQGIRALRRVGRRPVSSGGVHRGGSKPDSGANALAEETSAVTDGPAVSPSVS